MPAALDILLSRRILVLDGAMGTMVQRLDLDEEGYRGGRFHGHDRPLRHDVDILSLSRPEIVSDIHRAYLDAGADIIRTNTFAATATAQAPFGLAQAAYDINVAAARLARTVADEWSDRTPDRPRLVAGTMGPAFRSAAPSSGGHSPADESAARAAIRDAGRQQVRGLLDGGVDLLIVETVVDTRGACELLAAIRGEFAARRREVPVMVSATIDRSGRLPSGETLDAVHAAIEPLQPAVVGLNCGVGANSMRAPMAALASLTRRPLSCHPGAGLPDAAGRHVEGPADTAAMLRALALAGLVNVAGGCCGTTPDHIRAVAAAVRDLSPPASRAVPRG